MFIPSSRFCFLLEPLLLRTVYPRKATRSAASRKPTPRPIARPSSGSDVVGAALAAAEVAVGGEDVAGGSVLAADKVVAAEDVVPSEVVVVDVDVDVDVDVESVVVLDVVCACVVMLK
jgi:hypothetical protein